MITIMGLMTLNVSSGAVCWNDVSCFNPRYKQKLTFILAPFLFTNVNRKEHNSKIWSINENGFKVPTNQKDTLTLFFVKLVHMDITMNNNQSDFVSLSQII